MVVQQVVVKKFMLMIMIYSVQYLFCSFDYKVSLHNRQKAIRIICEPMKCEQIKKNLLAEHQSNLSAKSRFYVLLLEGLRRGQIILKPQIESKRLFVFVLLCFSFVVFLQCCVLRVCFFLLLLLCRAVLNNNLAGYTNNGCVPMLSTLFPSRNLTKDHGKMKY